MDKGGKKQTVAKKEYVYFGTDDLGNKKTGDRNWSCALRSRERAANARGQSCHLLEPPNGAKKKEDFSQNWGERIQLKKKPGLGNAPSGRVGDGRGGKSNGRLTISKERKQVGCT